MCIRRFSKIFAFLIVLFSVFSFVTFKPSEAFVNVSQNTTYEFIYSPFGYEDDLPTSTKITLISGTSTNIKRIGDYGFYSTVTYIPTNDNSTKISIIPSYYGYSGQSSSGTSIYTLLNLSYGYVNGLGSVVFTIPNGVVVSGISLILEFTQVDTYNIFIYIYGSSNNILNSYTNSVKIPSIPLTQNIIKNISKDERVSLYLDASSPFVGSSTEAYDKGYEAGFGAGITQINTEYYERGRADALAYISKDLNFYQALQTIILSPVIFLSEVFSFEIFGVNLFGVFAALLSIPIVFFAFKFIKDLF